MRCNEINVLIREIYSLLAADGKCSVPTHAMLAKFSVVILKNIIE